MPALVLKFSIFIQCCTKWVQLIFLPFQVWMAATTYFMAMVSTWGQKIRQSLTNWNHNLHCCLALSIFHYLVTFGYSPSKMFLCCFFCFFIVDRYPYVVPLIGSLRCPPILRTKKSSSWPSTLASMFSLNKCSQNSWLDP